MELMENFVGRRCRYLDHLGFYQIGIIIAQNPSKTDPEILHFNVQHENPEYNTESLNGIPFDQIVKSNVVELI